MRITGIPTTPTLSDEAAHKLYAKEILSAPTGTILMFGGSAAAVPTGFLLCDGSPVSRTVYSDLFNYYNSLSLPYGAGNGTTTFNVPNLKGRFPIGVGTNAPSLGSTGGSLNHTHTMGDHVHTQSHSHTMTHYHDMSHSHTINHRHQISNHSHGMEHMHWVPAHYHGISGSASGADHSHDVFVSAATAAGNSGIRGGTNASGTYTYNTQGAIEWSATTGGSVGNVGVRNGNGGFWSSGSQNVNTSGNPISVSYTSNYEASTNGTVASSSSLSGNSNSASTDSNTQNTGGMTTTPSVTSENPPFLTVHFIVKT